jgi:hypothetical protein
MAVAKDCPKCGMVNPPEAQRCDCGYVFVTGTSELARPTEQGVRSDSTRRKTSRVLKASSVLRLPWVLLAAGFVYGALLYGQGWSMRNIYRSSSEEVEKVASFLASGVYNTLAGSACLLGVFGFLVARTVGQLLQDQANRIEELERKISGRQ